MSLALSELPDIKSIFSTYITSGDGDFWVAEIDSEIAGCLGIWKLCNDDYEVRRMYTVEKFRGRGVAQRLN